MTQQPTADHFILPEGTHVVTRAAKSGGAPRITKPAGSVGIVTRSPVDATHRYTVTFSDGVSLRYTREELTIRRREVAEETTAEFSEFERYVIYKCLVGSKAFGLDTDASDDDVRGVYLPPAERHWSIFKVPEQLEIKRADRDETFWELEKYLMLALKANPNVLETFWTPRVLFKTEIADEMLALRPAFLSKHLYKTYSGYVLSQFKKMANAMAARGKYKAKHAMHLIRLLFSGIHALRTGEILVDVREHRDALLRVKSGALSFEEVKAWAHELDKEFQAAFAQTTLPDRPDYDRVNAFLVKARRAMVTHRT